MPLRVPLAALLTGLPAAARMRCPVGETELGGHDLQSAAVADGDIRGGERPAERAGGSLGVDKCQVHDFIAISVP